MTDDFFPPPPPPEEPEEDHEPPRQPWHGPPENVLGATVALDLVLAVGDEVAVTVPTLTVYPDGVSVPLLLRGRRFDSLQEPDDEWLPLRRRGDRAPEERLRFGVQYPDGSKATNVRTPAFGGDDPPPAPSLWPVGGGGGGRDYRHRFWLWPLPPPGTLTFVLEWRAAGIPLTRRGIEAAPILDAAERTITPWPEDPASRGPQVHASEWFEVGPFEDDREDEE